MMTALVWYDAGAGAGAGDVTTINECINLVFVATARAVAKT